MHAPHGDTARRRRAALVLGTVAVVSAILLWWVADRLPGWSPSPTAADREAAGYADDELLDELNEAADAHHHDRLSAVDDALRSRTGKEPTQNPPASVITGATTGTSIPAVVYYHWDDKSFSASSHYGTACRVFTVGENAVTAQSVACPANTPEHPFHGYQPEWEPGAGLTFPADMELCEYDGGELLC